MNARTALLLAILVAAVAGCSSEDEDATSPGIILLAPAGGEVWGGTRDIAWSSWFADGGIVDADVSADSGATWTSISTGIADTGTHSWYTAAVTDGSAFRVRVRITESGGAQSCFSASAADFAVDNTAPTASLTSPAGGEMWNGTRIVAWTASDLHRSTVDIEFSANSGTSWTSLAAGAPDTGTWVWDTTLSSDGSSCRLRLRAVDKAGNPSAWSASASDFTLDNTIPGVTLTSPVGGEVWNGVRSIAWSTTDAHPSTADLELSIDSGSGWTALATAFADTGSWPWDLSNSKAWPFLRVRVRARDLAGNVSAWSASSTDFKVLDWTHARCAGDTGVDRSFALAVDGSGNAYVGGMFDGTVDFHADWGGWTDSRTGVASDGFVMKINADGTYAWVRRIGDSGQDWVEALATDSSGNVYVCGKFAGTVDFRADWGGATDSRTASGDDGFIMRINVDGSYGWAKQIGGAGGDRVSCLAADSSGNVYAAGFFDGAVNFQADWGGTDNKTGASIDGFVTKVNSNGTYGWTRALGGAGYDSCAALAATPAGIVYASGSFIGTVNFQADWSGTDNRTSSGASTDAFLLKIQADGSYGWVRRIGGTGPDSGYGTGVDGSGNVYVTGTYANTVDFRADWGGGTDSRTEFGGSDAFVCKVNSDGSYGWTRSIGGTSLDQGTSLAFDASGNVFLAGYFDGTVDFRYDWGGTADSRTSGGGGDAFVMRIESGGSYGWVMAFGGSNADVISEIAVDGLGAITASGYFRGSVDFRSDWGGGTEPKSSVSGSSDVFVVKFK